MSQELEFPLWSPQLAIAALVECPQKLLQSISTQSAELVTVPQSVSSTLCGGSRPKLVVGRDHLSNFEQGVRTYKGVRSCQVLPPTLLHNAYSGCHHIIQEQGFHCAAILLTLVRSWQHGGASEGRRSWRFGFPSVHCWTELSKLIQTNWLTTVSISNTQTMVNYRTCWKMIDTIGTHVHCLYRGKKKEYSIVMYRLLCE